MTAFVDFRNVWLAYNDELLAAGAYAVEDISLQMGEGEFIAIVDGATDDRTAQFIDLDDFRLVEFEPSTGRPHRLDQARPGRIEVALDHPHQLGAVARVLAIDVKADGAARPDADLVAIARDLEHASPPGPRRP